MGFFDKLFAEFIDIIEWVDKSSDTLVWKFPRYQNEIKMGAKLTVRESQLAVFMNEGKIADVYQPGMYTLSTQNMPILSTLNGWKYGFDSPFKADIFFVSTRQFTGIKWSTKNPVMLRDAEFGPVRLRAYGTFAFRISDAAMFIKEVAATNPTFSVGDIAAQITSIIVSRGMDAIAEQKIPLLDLTSNYDEASAVIAKKIGFDMANMGLEITQLLIENISLPPEVERAIDKRSSIGIVGNLGQYTQFQAANSLENSSGGGLAGMGMSAGLGVALGQQMAGMMQGQGSGAVPPPINAASNFFIVIDGKQHGPFSMEKLQQLQAAQSLTKHTLVWKQGMKDWTLASSVDELSHLFIAPPPLPVQ
ncbi:MAG: SPFH domain-containing protein [Sphingobacteriales bacterium]|nr:MAG: SPFH domain-containing protein [Sphingobacteriales bacterium]